MKQVFNRVLWAGAVISIFIVSSAQATTGYFLHGYGPRASAMGGASVAFAQDSIAPAANPAGLSFVGNRADGGVQLFSPKREGELNATLIGGGASSEDSGATLFAIPDLGVSYQFTRQFAVGLTAVANGGLSSRYSNNIYTDAFAPAIPGFVNALIGQGFNPMVVGGNAQALSSNPNLGPSLGVNLAQALLLPTVSYKITKNHAVGVSAVLGYQTFRAYGLGLFQGLSSRPDKVTNNGNEDAFGAGVRVGYTGHLTNWLSIGATWASKVYMEEFDDYAGLFAQEGDFDIPANYAVGIAVKPTPRLTFTADAQRILYGDVKALNNEGPTTAEFFQSLTAALTAGDPNAPSVTRPLGTSNGFGFGWDDIWVFKAGVNYEYNSQWTMRLGYTYNQETYDDDQTLFNILAPAVIRQHLTAGFSYSPSNTSEWSVFYMHAFDETQKNFYDSSPQLGPGTGFSTENNMHQNAVGVGYAYKF